MAKEKLLTVHTLPGGKNAAFSERESEIAHTTYLEEVAFFSMIEQGNTEESGRAFEKLLATGVVAGRLSDDPVRQMKYFAVCCITLGIRYAIQGGLSEMKAYQLSDSYIRHIDTLSTENEIVQYLSKLVPELTLAVHESKHGNCPLPVRKSLNYIDCHLHENIRNSSLAELTGLNADYLARIFRKYVGKTIQEYILQEKLEEAKNLLRGGCDQKSLGYALGFSSQTYFITCFRKAFGITPHRYAEKYRGL